MTVVVPLVERIRLNEGSDKETYHLVFDISEVGLTYSVGDCVAVAPENDCALVEAVLSCFPKSDCEVTFRGERWLFRDFLTKRANLTRVPKALGKASHILQALEASHGLTAQDFTNLLPPLLPRFYSIASSMGTVGQELHLTVTVNENPPDSPTRWGTCSHYLCKRAPLFSPSVQLSIQKSKDFFLTPESFDKPIIMVGPGTGVAPFRGFLQERISRNAHENWLFFGERKRQFDYYYQEEWKRAEEAGSLTIDTAFSRDTASKLYVQDRMLARSQELWAWFELGAYFFVCGDAKKMAVSVEEALKKIIFNEGKIDPGLYIKDLRKNRRYLRDVY